MRVTAAISAWLWWHVIAVFDATRHRVIKTALNF
jgi:hypothetical protein